MPGVQDKGTEGWRGGCREGGKQEVKEIAGAEKEREGRVKMCAMPHSRGSV